MHTKKWQLFLQPGIKIAEFLQYFRQTDQQIIGDQSGIACTGQTVRADFAGETVKMDPDLRSGEWIVFLRQKCPDDPGQNIAASRSGKGRGAGEIDRLSAIAAIEDPGVRSFLNKNAF